MPVEMRVTLRLPLAIHTALTTEAKSTAVSLNQLIVDKLNTSVGSPYRGGAEASIADRVDALESELEAIRGEIRLLAAKSNAKS
jgi:hypothetical protein